MQRSDPDLPVGADEFTVFHSPNDDGLYRVSARCLQLDDTTAKYDISMVHADGTVCAFVKGSTFRRISE